MQLSGRQRHAPVRRVRRVRRNPAFPSRSAPGVARRAGAGAPAASRASYGVSVLVCGPAAFGEALSSTLGEVRGVTLVGHSPGEAMAAELTRAGWPDVVLVDDVVGRKLAGGDTGPEMRGAAGRCGVVMVTDPDAGPVHDPSPVKLRQGWSVLLRSSAGNATLLGQAVQAAARGAPMIDPALDTRLIAYVSEESRRSLGTAGNFEA